MQPNKTQHSEQILITDSSDDKAKTGDVRFKKHDARGNNDEYREQSIYRCVGSELASLSKAAAMSSSNCPTKNQIPIAAKPTSFTSEGRLGWSGSPSQRYNTARTGATGRFDSDKAAYSAAGSARLVRDPLKGPASHRLAALNRGAPEFVSTSAIVSHRQRHTQLAL